MKKRYKFLRNRFPVKIISLVILTTVFFSYGNVSAQQKGMMIRMSEIEIYPAYVKEYKSILQEEAFASVQVEPGVLAIFPMYQKIDSTQIRILEMYDSKDAYQSHLKTSHFQKYKTSTLKMVKSLKLVDMDAIDPEAMPAIFRKLSN